MTQLIDGFLLTCRVEGKSTATVKFYEGILRRFAWYLNQFGISIISPMVIRGFLGYIQSTEQRWGSNNSRATKKAGPVTLQRYYTGLKVFFNWCIQERYIEESPMVTLKKPKAPKKVVKALTPQEINMLLNSLKGRRDFNSVRNRAIVLLGLDTGLRLSEITNLNLLDLTSDVLTVTGKGSKQRIVRVGANVQKAIWRYLLLRSQIAGECDTLWVASSGKPFGIWSAPQKGVQL